MPAHIVEGKSKFYSYAGELFLPTPLLPGNNTVAMANAVSMATAPPQQQVRPVSNPAVAVVRLYIMSYFPCGFWPRIITRFLGDETFGKLAESLYDTSTIPSSPAKASVPVTLSSPCWRCWQTGLELIVLGKAVALRVNECCPDLEAHWCHAYRSARLMVPQEPDYSFSPVDISGMSVLEVVVPSETVLVEGVGLVYPDVRTAAALMTHAVDRIDTLLEDWYPDIGIRLVQNTKGIYLITRLVPCVRCLLAVQQVLDSDSDSWSLVHVAERTWTPEVLRPVRITSKNPVTVVTAAAAANHHRSSSVPVRTDSREKSSSADVSRHRPSHRNRS